MGRVGDTKETLLLKLTKLTEDNMRQKRDYDKIVKNLQSQIAGLKTEIDDYKKRESIVTTDDEIIKFMLEEKAKNKSIGVIARLVEKTYYKDYTSEEVDILIGNIADLSLSMQEFYANCVSKYKKLRETDDSLERDNIVSQYDYHYNKLSVLLESLNINDDNDRKLFVEVNDKMKNILNEKAKVIGAVKENGFATDETLIKIAKGLSKIEDNVGSIEEEISINNYAIC